jgi:tetratricopeptide (TPR) repeat protein
MSARTGANAAHSRNLCELGAWAELLDFARQWQAEFADDHRAPYYCGLAHAGLGQFPQAEAAYRRALALDATDPKVWNNLAAVLFENLGQPAEGIRCMQQALQLDPDHKTGWANLATMVGQLGQFDRAIEYAERALALDPNLVEAHLHKAAAARALGRAELVREACLALASIPPENFRRAR